MLVTRRLLRRVRGGDSTRGLCLMWTPLFHQPQPEGGHGFLHRRREMRYAAPAPSRRLVSRRRRWNRLGDTPCSRGRSRGGTGSSSTSTTPAASSPSVCSRRWESRRRKVGRVRSFPPAIRNTHRGRSRAAYQFTQGRKSSHTLARRLPCQYPISVTVTCA